MEIDMREGMVEVRRMRLHRFQWAVIRELVEAILDEGRIFFGMPEDVCCVTVNFGGERVRYTEEMAPREVAAAIIEKWRDGTRMEGENGSEDRRVS